MFRLPFLSAFLTTAFTVGATANGDELSGGRWRLDAKRFEDDRVYFVEFEVEGEKVSGNWISPRTGSYPFEGGTFKDGKLQFDVRRVREDTTRVYGMRLEKQGERFVGKFLYNGEEAGPVIMRRYVHPAIGNWDVVVTVPNGGEYKSVLEVRAADDGLKARTVGENGSRDVKEFSAGEEVIEYLIVLPVNGEDTPFEVRAEFESQDQLVGRWNQQGTDVGGEWRATRATVPPDPETVAALQGTWSGSVGEIRLEIKVAESKLSGTVHAGDTTREIQNAKITGKKLQFSVGGERGPTVVLELKDGALVGRAVRGDRAHDVSLQKARRL